MKNILTTNEGGPKFRDPVLEPAKRGPMTGSGGADGKNFILANATPEEIRAFEKTIRDRMASEPREVWQICDKCGYVSTRGFRTPAGKSCFKCNFQSVEGGGMMRDMKAGEIRAHGIAKAKADAEWIERTRLAAYNADCQNRRAGGLTPWTREEFDAKREAEWEKRRAEDREMMDLARKLTKDLR